MDKTQSTSSLPRRLPRKPKAESYPAESLAEDTSLAPNVSYFVADIEAPAPSPAAEVSVTPPPATPIKQQNLPPSIQMAQPTPSVDRIWQEPAPPETAPRPASEDRQKRPSNDDPKPGYARSSGVSRSRPIRRSGVSTARSSVSLPVARETRSREVFAAAQETTPLRVSAEDPVSAPISQVRQSKIRSVASRTSIPVLNNDTALPSTPVSPVTKSTDRRVPRKRKIPAGIALTVLSCILVAYSFTVGSIENEVDRLIVDSETIPAFVKSMLPWLPLLPLILLLGIVLWILAGMIGLRRTKHRVEALATSGETSVQQRKTKRRKAPLERFRDEAEKEGIGKDAAYQAWRLLQMYGPDSHILSVYDDLYVTLSMTQQQIQDVYQQLAPAARNTVSARSVLDLMRFVNSPQRSTALSQKAAR